MTEEKDKKKKKSVTEDLVHRLEKDRDRLLPKTYNIPRTDPSFAHIDDAYIYNIPPTPILAAQEKIDVEVYNPTADDTAVESNKEDVPFLHMPAVGHYEAHEAVRPTEEPYFSNQEVIDLLIKANKKIEDLETVVNNKHSPDGLPSKSAADGLKAMVDDFNKSLKTWYQMTGCVVNFGWKYDAYGHKMLEISGIDYIVYRKPAPSEESLKTALKQGTP